MLGSKGIIESLISKLGEETQRSWILYLGNTLEEDECKAFRKWIAIKERVAEIFKHHLFADE